MAQDAQLLLKVGLDLSTFRNQLATLGQAAAGYNLPIKLKFARKALQEEVRYLKDWLGTKKFDIELNIVGGLTKDQFEKIQGRLDALSKTKAVEIPIGIKNGAVGQDVNRVVASIKERIAKNQQISQGGGKLRIETSIKPSVTNEDIANLKKIAKDKLGKIGALEIATKLEVPKVEDLLKGLQKNFNRQKPLLAKTSIKPSILRPDVAAFKKAVEEKLSGISVKINAEIGAIGGGKTKAQIEKEALAGWDRIQQMGAERMGGVSESARRESLRQSLQGRDIGELRNIGAQLGVANVGRFRNTQNLIEKIVTESSVEMIKKYLDPQAVMRNPDRSGLDKVLDTFARGVFRMLGMDPAAIRAQEAEKRRLPAINWDAMVPPARGVSTASTMALAPGRAFPQLPGSAFAEQKRLVGDILNPALKEALRNAANAFIDAVRNGLNAAVRGVQVRDLGAAGRPMLGGGRVAGLLPAGVGRTASPYSTGALGRDGETRAEMLARREREARMRSALREMDVMGGGAGRAPSPYSQSYRAARSFSAIVPYQTPGALVAAGGGGGGGGGGAGGAGGGGGFGGFGGLGGSMGGLNLPGAGLIRELGGEFAFATKQVLLFGQAYKLLGFAQDFPAQVGQAVAQLQNFNNTLKAISPTSQEVVASNQLIIDLVERYNIPLQSARDGFTKLYASMQPAGFSGDQVRGLFTGISKAAATFGMSADKVDRVNYAFAQMASKGQVMSEELKGQLGDVLPGAMAIFAQAAGFKGPEAITKFSEALEDGRYKGTAMMELLNNVSIVLNEKFSAGAEGAAKTFQGAINNMQTSMKGLYESFEPIATTFLNGVVSPMMTGIKVVTDGLNAFFSGTQTKTAGGFALSQALEQLRPSFEGIRQNATQIVEVLGQFAKAALGVAQILLQIAGNPVVGYLAKVYLNVLVLTTAIQLLNLKALIPMIANLVRSAAALIGFTVQCARAGQSAQAMGLMAQTAGLTLRTFFASTGVGLVVVGIGLLIERFMTMNQALADTRAKALGAAQAIRAMSATEARQAGFQAARDVKLLQQLSQQEQVGGVFGRKFLTPNKEQQAALQRAGVTTQTIYNKRQGYGVTQGARIEDLAGAIQARQGILREAQYRERQVKFEEQQANKPTSFAEIKGSGDGGAAKPKGTDKAANDAKRLAEEIARQAMAASDALFSERQRLLVMQQTDPTAKALVEYANQELVIQRELNQALKEAKSEKEKDDQRAIAATKQQVNALTLDQELARARKEAMQPLEDALHNQREQLLVEQDIKKLVAEGMVPERAKEVAEIRKLTRAALEQIDAQIKVFDKQIEIAKAAILERRAREGSTKAVQEMIRALDDLEKRRKKAEEDKGEAKGKGKEAEAGVPKEKEAKSPLDYIKEGAASAQAELAKLTNWGYQAVEAGKAIGSAFGTAFKDLISGSASAQEALAGMMQSIADHFLDMAAQIIAQQVTMMIYGIILKALGVMGGAASGGGSLSDAFKKAPGTSFVDAMKMPKLAANGAVWEGGFQAFANGGMVTGPTLGLVGEGKYNEAIVPLPDGRSIPVQLQDSSIRDKMGSDMAGTGGSPMLSMSFQSTTINGVEYVDRAQLEAAMAETRRISVREGATRGATIALDKLANSPSSRRRVGLR